MILYVYYNLLVWVLGEGKLGSSALVIQAEDHER